MSKTQQQLNDENLSLIIPGTVVDVEVLTPTASKRFKTEFIGLSKERFIIIGYPSSKRLANASEYLKDGTTIIVRALLDSGGGQVIAFRQQLMSIASHPARLLFLSYPSKVQLISLRAQPRIPTLIPGKITFENGQSYSGVIKDVSVQGVLFDINETGEFDDLKDTTCNIKLDKETKGVSQFKGEVCSVRGRATGTQFGIQLLTSEGEMKVFMQEHFIDVSMLEDFT